MNGNLQYPALDAAYQQSFALCHVGQHSLLLFAVPSMSMPLPLASTLFLPTQ